MSTPELCTEARLIRSEPRTLQAVLLGLSPQARRKIRRLIDLLARVQDDELTIRALQPVKGLDAQIALLESRLQRRG